MAYPDSSDISDGDTGRESQYNNLRKDALEPSHAVLSGLDASKSATPDVGDVYLAYDTSKIYFCTVDDAWGELTIPTVPLEFVEIAIPYQSKVTTKDTWEDWDLSPFIPSGAKYADVLIKIDQGKEAGVRKTDSAVDRIFKNWNNVGSGSFMAHGELHSTNSPVYGIMPFYVTMTVELDSNRHVERRTNDFTTSAYYTVVGYWK